MDSTPQGDQSNELGQQPATDLAASSVPTPEFIDVFVASPVVSLDSFVDAPANILRDGSLPPGRIAGESAPVTLAPEIVKTGARSDQLELDLKQGGSTSSSYGDRSLDLPEALGASNLLERDGTNPIDIGVGFANGPDSDEQRSLYRNIVATVREPMLVLDVDLRVRFANDSFYRVFAVAEHETLEQRLYDLGGGQWDIPRLRHLLDEVLSAGVAFNDYELEHDFERVGLRVMLLNARRLNAPDLILVAIEDITERKRIERERERALELAEKTLDTVREPMLVLDNDLRVLSANAAFYTMFKVERSETEGKSVYELGNGGWDIPGLHELLEDVLPHNHLFNGYRVDHAFEGIGRRRMLVNARRIDHIQLILLAIEDVTGRERSAEELAESEERFRAMSDGLPLIVWVHGPDGKLQFVNATFCEFFGVTPEVAEGDGWQIPMHPDDAAAYTSQFLSCIAERRPFNAETRVFSAAGEWRSIESWARPRFSSVGEFLGFVGASADVTDRRKAEEELREANHIKDELLGMISHEFRTPLTVISGNIDILARRFDKLPDAVRLQMFEDLQMQKERLQRLVDNMLLLARGEAHSHAEIEPLHVERLLERAIALEHHGDPSRPVVLSIEHRLGIAMGNEGYLEQVLENLITNARKYGHPTTPIHISAVSEATVVRITVRNRGEVLDAEEVARFLEPFYRREHHERSVGGAGLGLSVCRILVAAMGGRLSARPNQGGGLEVSLTLPLLDPAIDRS